MLLYFMLKNGGTVSYFSPGVIVLAIFGQVRGKNQTKNYGKQIFDFFTFVWVLGTIKIQISGFFGDFGPK